MNIEYEQRYATENYVNDEVDKLSKANRTHYIENVEGTTLVDESFATLSSGTTYYATLSGSCILEAGKTYKVIFNDVTYKCTAYASTTIENAIVIGNGSIYGGDGGNDEPFSCDSYSDGSINVNTTESMTGTIKIIELNEVVHKLDEKYLPNYGEENINKVLTIGSDGSLSPVYPVVIDATKLPTYQTANGDTQQLFVVDIANPILGIFVLPPISITWLRVKNGDTNLGSTSVSGMISYIHVDKVYGNTVRMNAIYSDGHVVRYVFDTDSAEWTATQMSYAKSELDTKFAELSNSGSTGETTGGGTTITLSDSVTTEDSNTAASSTAVKIAYDKAVEALNAVNTLDAEIAAIIGSGVVS